MVDFCSNPQYNCDDGSCQFCCPISNTEFNGLNPFVVIWTNGRVLSEKAMREMGGIDHLQVEYGPFTELDLVRLLPLTGEECLLQTQHMEKRRTARKVNAKASKLSRQEGKSGVESHAGGPAAVGSSSIISDKSKRCADSSVSANVASKKVRGTSDDSKFSSSVSSCGISAATRLVQQSDEAVLNQESKSGVYKSLFHNEKHVDFKKPSGRDLMMSTAGLRYSIG